MSVHPEKGAHYYKGRSLIAVYEWMVLGYAEGICSRKRRYIGAVRIRQQILRSGQSGGEQTFVPDTVTTAVLSYLTIMHCQNALDQYPRKHHDYSASFRKTSRSSRIIFSAISI